MDLFKIERSDLDQAADGVYVVANGGVIETEHGEYYDAEQDVMREDVEVVRVARIREFREGLLLGADSRVREDKKQVIEQWVPAERAVVSDAEESAMPGKIATTGPATNMKTVAKVAAGKVDSGKSKK